MLLLAFFFFSFLKNIDPAWETYYDIHLLMSFFSVQEPTTSLPHENVYNLTAFRSTFPPALMSSTSSLPVFLSFFRAVCLFPTLLPVYDRTLRDDRERPEQSF